MPADDPPLIFEQPRSMFGTWLGVVLLFAVFGLFVWAVMGIMPRGDDYEQKRAMARVDKLKAVRDEASAALHGFAWVDKAKGTVRVPIQRAMELTVAELAQKKPVPANPIAPEVPPAPSAAPAASPSAEAVRPQPGVNPPTAKPAQTTPGAPSPAPAKP